MSHFRPKWGLKGKCATAALQSNGEEVSTRSCYEGEKEVDKSVEERKKERKTQRTKDLLLST
jgi:hypothetical protein